jgi:tetratricopeptide (TPR) repeat protein
MKVYVYAISKNESKHVERWMRSMGEADGIYVLDTGSEDDTVAQLRAAGAVVDQEIIEPWRFDVARNRSLEMVPEDGEICVCTDLDEVLHPGWRALLEQSWTPGTTRASYRYTWNFNPDGSEGYVFWIDNVHARHGYTWIHPVHEILKRTDSATPEQRVRVEGMQLDHLADPNKSRAQYLELLEFSVQEDPEDDRNMHYLGREYMFRHKWDQCISTLKKHLAMPRATWEDERCASMRFIARAYKNKGNNDEAKRWYWRAIAEAPHLREPYIDLARLLYEEKSWDGVVYLTNLALSIQERPCTYICESEAWGSLPWDLNSLGLYYTGRIREALDAAKKASALAPTDERLQKNVMFIEKKMWKIQETDRIDRDK